MKIVYIGAADALAEALTERMGQEGHDVYLLSDNELQRQPKGARLHHFYRRPRRGESFARVLSSISPECVIFAGNHYISGADEESDEDVSLLARTLRTAAAFPHMRFILLSSTEVYGNTWGKADESAQPDAVTERGIRFVREEQLLDIYQKRHGMNAVILRASHLYSNRPKEGAGDFLSRSFAAAEAQGHMSSGVFQPLHVSDFVDAVKRVTGAGKRQVYNVCGSGEISAQRLYQLICQQEKLPEQDVQWEEPSCVTLGDSGQIRQELGWSDFRSLEAQLQGGEITYARAPAEKRKKEKSPVPAAIRQLAENLLVFSVFFALNSLCASHSLFSRINWLMIYVILIAISYNIYQSALAALLASAACLYIRGSGSVPQVNTFYSYADSILAVMEFVFLGLMVSYTVNTLKEDTRSVRLDLEMVREEYEDLKAVNEENVLIKNEYEERLLTSKTGFPKLYGLVSRLMVQEPERILMETMQVISELVNTDTVAVYQGQGGSPWLRLVGALGESSAMDGKTWNLSGYPRIQDAVARGELYQGEFGSGEPAAVLPIVCHGVPEAVVLIKTLPYESETLYHVNLLKTMSLLLRDSMEKAMQYEELSREEHYVPGTDILKPEAFRKRLLLAEEKAGKSMAEYCIAELVYSGSMAEAASASGQALRVTDCMGTDGEGRLFALLNNTGPGNLEHLQKRLLPCGVEIRPLPEEQAAVMGEPATV